MPTRFWFRVAEFALTAILAIILAGAWRADRRDRAQLAVDLATAKRALAQADSRQHDRDAQLQQSLKALASEKRNVTTPAQILRELPRQISLPAPITLELIPPQKSSDGITPSRVVPASGVARDPQE